MSTSRREFLQAAAALTFASTTVDAATGMPMRPLGRTGKKVSILAFGCGSRFLSYKEEDQALDALNHALDLGITYVDTAFGYGDGLSETRVGKVMATRRNEVWLATKINKRKGDEAMRIIEDSLKRLQTDRVDVLHIHALMDEEDLKAIEAPDGVLKRLYQLRDQKVATNIGITCHHNPDVLKMAIERNDFDCTQMALNGALVGMKSIPGGMDVNLDMTHSFEAVALPVALKKKMGVIAMKVFGQERLVDKAPLEKLVQYSMSLPVSVAVIGMPKREFIAQNVNIAKAFRPMPKNEMKQFSGHLAEKHKMALDLFFADHVDA